MSDETAQEIMDYYAKGDLRKRQRDLLARMEHKFLAKQRRSFDRSARH